MVQATKLRATRQVTVKSNMPGTISKNAARSNGRMGQTPYLEAPRTWGLAGDELASDGGSGMHAQL